MRYNKLLVAKHTQSLEHPYYFWTGYFIPIANELRKQKYDDTMFVVRECGPMTPWLESLQKMYPITIKSSGLILKYYLIGMPSIVFDYWDNSDKFVNDEFQETIKFLKNIYNLPTNNNKNNIGILNRNNNFDFKKIEIPKIKDMPVRSIKNINELHSAISNFYNSELIDTSDTNPEDAIQIYSNLKVLIGQWGAGLTNMIWMDKGSLIIEICARPMVSNDVFELLANALGHKFIRIFAQNSWTEDVNIDLIMDILKKEGVA